MIFAVGASDSCGSITYFSSSLYFKSKITKKEKKKTVVALVNRAAKQYSIELN